MSISGIPSNLSKKIGNLILSEPSGLRRYYASNSLNYEEHQSNYENHTILMAKTDDIF